MKRKKNAFLVGFACGLTALLGAQWVQAQALTPREGAELLQRFLPDEVVRDRRFMGMEEMHGWPLEEMAESIAGQKDSEMPTLVGYMGPFWNYFELPYGGEGRRLVLLYWCEGNSIWWRLVEKPGTEDYRLLQEGEGWYGGVPNDIQQVRLQDLDADGIPELLLFSGESHAMDALFVFRWQGGRLVRITPRKLHDILGDYDDIMVVSELGFRDMENAGIHLEDLDGDGKAEIIQGPDSEAVYKYDEEGNRLENDRTWRAVTPTRIFRLVNGLYELWREADPSDPYPVRVPSIGAIHPSTLPLSELSNPGNGKLRVFVSHPAGTATADDYETGRFKFQQTALAFQKRWTNARQPDTASANFEWFGCPVKQTERQGGGEWQVNPSDPAVPSPEGRTEYHFVGPYLELEIPRSAVYPYLLQAATAAFAREPSRETYFVEVPLTGQMKNGKLAAVSAVVCIQKTGPSKPEAPSATPAPPSTTPAEGKAPSSLAP